VNIITRSLQFDAAHDWRVVTLPVAPTAQVLLESLAVVVAQRCDYRVELQRVTVQETPTRSATDVP
jgi:6-pyruvoyl-tetrahydropterin synthase